MSGFNLEATGNEAVRRHQEREKKRHLTFNRETIPGRCTSVVKIPIYSEPDPDTKQKKIVGYKVTITTELD